MTTWSSATITTTSNEVGGPKVVTGTIDVISGDTGGSIDLSAYFAKEIKHVLVEMRTAGTMLITAVDISTVATTMTITHTNPAAGAEISFVARGR